MAKLSKGAAGEVLAARFLRKHGYTLRAANFRTRFGEIDIIAEQGEYLVFVEVKTRAEDALYAPREAVTSQKQERLIKTAMLYLQQFPTERQPRFDVIEVTTFTQHPQKAKHIEHIENAFGV